jgi:hypothetical protein
VGRGASGGVHHAAHLHRRAGAHALGRGYAEERERGDGLHHCKVVLFVEALWGCGYEEFATPYRSAGSTLRHPPNATNSSVRVRL